MFQKATKLQSRLRLALCGPAGSGKTYTALSVAEALGRVAVLDTERGSASKYSDRFSFDVVELSDYHPEKYVDVIREAEAAGYDVLVIDSLSHAWSGKGGALDLKDKATARSRSGNSYTAWREVTPLHNALVDAILGSSCHVIVTMRSKTEYILEDNGKGSKTPRKVGMAPVQREGMDYEFDVVGDLDWNHTLVVSKSRCSELSGAVVKEPGAEFAAALAQWVGSGAKPAPTPEPTEPTAQDLRALIRSQLEAGAWTIDGVRALLATFGVAKAAELSKRDLSTAAETLNTQTGESWQETQG
jgi:hypothetical protein